jgi:hypothetical protein
MFEPVELDTVPARPGVAPTSHAVDSVATTATMASRLRPCIVMSPVLGRTVRVGLASRLGAVPAAGMWTARRRLPLPDRTRRWPERCTPERRAAWPGHVTCGLSATVLVPTVTLDSPRMLPTGQSWRRLGGCITLREGAVGSFVYSTQILTEIGPLIEQVVRHDVGLATPVPYDFIDDPGAAAGEEGAQDDWRHGIGLGWTAVGTIRFRLPWPPVASLTVRLVQFGLVTYVGSLRYAIELDRHLDANVTFERDKHRGGPTFIGGAAASRLNATPDLAKRVASILREEFMSGALWVRGDGCGMALRQGEPGSTLDLWTYGRNDYLGRNATTDAGRMLEIAGVIQETI